MNVISPISQRRPQRTARHRAARVVLSLLFIAGAALPAPAQEPEFSLVTSTGTATVYTEPTHAVFWIHETTGADTLEAALEPDAPLEPALRQFLAQNEIRATEIEASAPGNINLEPPTTRTSVKLRFTMSAYAGAGSGARKFGALCDLLKEFAEAPGRELSGPEFITSDQAEVVEAAVRNATTEAYTEAAGAAAALNTRIRSVDMVEVESITWNAPPGSETAYPTLDQIACTAKTRVTYLVE